jgi:dipeptidyl aminopeptidase/acylaminoacyl peptidase
MIDRSIIRCGSRPITVDDALNMVRIGNVMMSPDGEKVFYSKTELDWEKNDHKSTYYMTSAKTG